MHAPLTFRQERFVFEYLKDQNASAAAGRAGYTAANLASQGNELLKNPAVRDRVRVEMESLLAEIRCSELELMRQRARTAFFDPGQLLDGWEPVPLDALGAEARAALEVSTVLRRSGPVVRVKQGCRHRALRALERVQERMLKLREAALDRAERLGALPTQEELEAWEREEDALQEARRAQACVAAARIEAEPTEAGRIEAGQAEIERVVVEQVEPGRTEVGRIAAEPDTAVPAEVLRRDAEAWAAQWLGEKPRVLSGRARDGEERAARFSEKTQVLSGRPVQGAAGGMDLLRGYQVLSGVAASPPPAVSWPARVSGARVGPAGEPALAD